MKDVVECSHGRSCGSLHPDHHGWDCPLSDPMGDVLIRLSDPCDNKILEQARKDLLKKWMNA